MTKIRARLEIESCRERLSSFEKLDSSREKKVRKTKNRKKSQIVKDRKIGEQRRFVKRKRERERGRGKSVADSFD